MSRYVLLKIEDEDALRQFLQDTAYAITSRVREDVELLTPIQENYVGFEIVSVVREGTPEAIKAAIEVTYRQARHYERTERAELEQCARAAADQRVADRLGT
jgi:hypothetical protein